MLTDFRIVVDPETIRISSFGSITGEIYWKLEETCFPQDQWNDFIVVILTWWVESYLRLESGEQESEFTWMDGPYHAVVAQLPDGLLLVRCIDGHSETQIATSKTSLAQFKKQLVNAADVVLNACNSEVNVDANRLKELLSKGQ